jgi:hypothetical protein
MMGEPNTIPDTESADGDRVRISLLVPADLRASIEKLAAREKRTITGQCEYLLERAIREVQPSIAA